MEEGRLSREKMYLVVFPDEIEIITASSLEEAVEKYLNEKHEHLPESIMKDLNEYNTLVDCIYEVPTIENIQEMYLDENYKIADENELVKYAELILARGISKHRPDATINYMEEARQVLNRLGLFETE